MPLSNEENENAFGFVKNPRNRIKDIVPSGAPPIPDLERVDEAAGKAGFVSREPTGVPSYSPGEDLRAGVRVRRPTMALNMRPPVEIAKAFISFCGKERYSYPEGLEELMRRSGIISRTHQD